VPLRVVCDMDEQSSHGSRQPFLAYDSRFFQIRLCQCTHPRRCISQRGCEFGEEFIARCSGIEFREETRQLFFAQASSFGISQ
jgi:hypothetical protein